MKKLGKVIIATYRGAQIPREMLKYSKPGHIEFSRDVDKRVRRLELVRLLKDPEVVKGVRISKYCFEPSLVFRITQEYFGVNYIAEGKCIYGVEKDGQILKIGAARKIPIDGEGMMYIRNIGKGQHFYTLSYQEVYNEDFDCSQIDTRSIVIIGSDLEPNDIHDTPYGEINGMMLNALALNTILKEAYLCHVSGYPYWLMIFGSSLSFLISLVSTKKSIAKR